MNRLCRSRPVSCHGKKRTQRWKRAIAAGRSEAKTIAFDELPHRQALLDADTTIISGGLDWQYKDLRALWQLKQAYRFSYCAILYDLIAVQFPHFVIPGYVELLTDYFGELLWLADQNDVHFANNES